MTTPGPRSAATRQRLIEAAIALIAQGGADALTLRALGEHCGLSRQAPYRHFEDKDSLLRAVAAAGFRALTERMHEAARSDDVGLAPAMHAYVDWAMANPAWYRLTFQDRVAAPVAGQLDASLSGAGLELLTYVTELVADAQRAGEMPDGPPEPLVGVLWSTLHGAVDLALAGHAKPELDTATPHQVVDRLATIMAVTQHGTSARRRGRRANSRRA